MVEIEVFGGKWDFFGREYEENKEDWFLNFVEWMKGLGRFGLEKRGEDFIV